jgi:double-stranded uracil-DNA glycosylase
MITHPLKPIIDNSSKVLILGSFPSVISRKKLCYYANPQNRFWKVLSELYQEDIIDKEEFILKHHLALWDVIQSCELHHSDDSSIRDVIPNKIEELINIYPIKLIVLNGKKAESLYKQYFKDLDIKIVSCPSTSSANAKFKLNDLVSLYAIVKEVK